MTPTTLNIEKVQKMVEVDGRRLDCTVYGSGSPTIVLISGFGAPQWTWNSIVPSLAEHSTVVTYDRPGYGKSEMGDAPNHGLRAAEDLHSLLSQLEVPQEFLIVGHSYGCGVARLFATSFPDQTRGLVLVDGQHEDILEQQRKVLTGEDLEILESMVARMAAPDKPKSEMEWTEVTNQQIRESGPLSPVPLTVITSGSRRTMVPPMFSEAGREKLLKVNWQMIEKLATLVPDGKHLVIDGAGHMVHKDKPEAVVDPICSMLEQINQGTP